ncbi:hypothetical protein KL936_001450 [Ogataea polymorpha]|nr:hypothetical protein KL936_001450 [Ogataea polymorpha]
MNIFSEAPEAWHMSYLSITNALELCATSTLTESACTSGTFLLSLLCIKQIEHQIGRCTVWCKDFRKHNTIMSLATEIAVLSELVDVLMSPESFNISAEDLFTHLNSTSRQPAGSDVTVRTIDFHSFLELGYKLTDTNMTVENLITLLSSNVYINNLSEVPIKRSDEYLPDLRFVIKNTFLLFITFFKRVGQPNPSVAGLVMLLNVSIVNKLIKILKALNPNIRLKSEGLLLKLMRYQR